MAHRSGGNKQSGTVIPDAGSQASISPSTPEATPEARLASAFAKHQAGHTGEATDLYRELLSDFPDYAEPNYLLSLILIQQENYRDALHHLVRAAMANPEDFRVQINLAGVYRALDADDLAVHHYEDALRLKPDIAEAHFNLGAIRHGQNDYELAHDALSEAISLDPNYYRAHLKIGNSLEHMGRLEEAAKHYLRAHRLDPGRLTPLSELADLPPRYVSVDLLEVLGDIGRLQADDIQADEQRRIAFNFAYGRALANAGRHEEAFAAISAANREKNRLVAEEHGLERAANEEVLDFVRSSEFGAYDGGSGKDFPVTSLFILGASRSGKTTLERLLAASGNVKPGFENRIVQHRLRRSAQFCGQMDFNSLLALPPDFAPVFCEMYCSRVQHLAGDSAVFTVTTPGNIVNVGRLIETVPKARCVLVRRERRDQMVGIFFRHYADGNAYAYDLDHIAGYLDWYHALGDAWAEKFPDHVRVMQYEDIVKNPAAVAAEVLAWCGVTYALDKSDAVTEVGNDRGVGAPYVRWMI